MKKLLVSLLVLAGLSFSAAQTEAPESAFDFWVGRWDVHWYINDTVRIDATNFIEKILDGRVLQEHFVDTVNNFKGTSISVFRPVDSTWRQAWADNQGGYFDFIGEIDGDTRIFRTHRGGKGVDSVMQRMRFYDIQEGSFTWDWERTRDAGTTWDLLWRIYYERGSATDNTME